LRYLVIPLIGYCLGSLPTAYLAVRWKLHQDIRLLGSGNVGALNCFLVTGSKILGLIVLFVDVAKGVVALLIVRSLFGGDFWDAVICSLAAVGGHNYSAWIGFRGGRGLATSTGAFLLLGWPLLILWAVLWLISFWRTRDILLGNGWATLLTPILLIVAPGSVVHAVFPESAQAADLVLFVAMMSSLVLARHVRPVVEILRERRRVQAS